MNDNRRRSEQWQQMVGEFFAPILGGPAGAWSEANREVANALFNRDAWTVRVRASHSYADFDRTYRLDWLRGMCELVGVAVPGQEESLELTGRAMKCIPPRVRAAFPGAVDTIRLLHAHRYHLNTASGESSADLSGYLGGMGVRHCFERLYGPDLIDTCKEDPDYYRLIFADAGVASADAVVVDDNLHAALRAAGTGARAVLVSNTMHADPQIAGHITSLVDLPSILERLA